METQKKNASSVIITTAVVVFRFPFRHLTEHASARSFEITHPVSITGKMPLPSSCRGLLLHFPLAVLILLVPPPGSLPDAANLLLADGADPPPPPAAPQVLHRQEAAAGLVVQAAAAAVAATAVIEEFDVDRAWAGR